MAKKQQKVPDLRRLVDPSRPPILFELEKQLRTTGPKVAQLLGISYSAYNEYKVAETGPDPSRPDGQRGKFMPDVVYFSAQAHLALVPYPELDRLIDERFAVEEVT